MLARSLKTGLTLLLAGVVVGDQALLLRGQDIAPPVAAAPAADMPAVPRGVEVLARGPVHEAFASLTTEAAPTKPVAKQPPRALDEMPPAEKPEGDVVWIGGYWAWDDDRNDFLWVSGTWRATPPGKQWVAGYWREDGGKWQWVAGFWTAVKEKEQQDVTYLPQPPALPEVAPPGEAPHADSFYVPGHWVWKGDRYGWQSGYWGRVEPGYVWVAGHYRWTPGGYIYVAGYWDYAVSKRGILYAPVIIDPNVVVVGYVYTPCYAVRETIVVDSLWVRPSRCHYYFGDYYGVEYRDMGYESCAVYSRSHYDSIIVYERWEHRREPDWVGIQINVYNDRYEHRDARPPRTLVQQNTTVINNTTIINNNTVINNNTKNALAPATQIAAAKGVRTVPVDNEARLQARQQAVAVQQVSVQRGKSEVAAPGGAPTQPRVATLSVPKQQPIVTKAAAPGVAATMAPVGGTKTPVTTGSSSVPPSTTGLASTGTKPATIGAMPSTNPATGTSAIKPLTPTTGTNPVATTGTPAIKPPATGTGVNSTPPALTTTSVHPATTGTTPALTPTTGIRPATGTNPVATTGTTATMTPTTPTTHPASQLQPIAAPAPTSPFGSGPSAKPATSAPYGQQGNRPATTPSPAPTGTGMGHPPAQPPAIHPNPPPRPVDPPAHKPPPPKDKENKDKDKDR